MRHGIEAGLVAQGADISGHAAEAADRRINDLRLRAHARFVTDAKSLGRARSEIFHDCVRLLDESKKQIAAFLCFQEDSIARREGVISA